MSSWSALFWFLGLCADYGAYCLAAMLGAVHSFSSDARTSQNEPKSSTILSVPDQTMPTQHVHKTNGTFAKSWAFRRIFSIGCALLTLEPTVKVLLGGINASALSWSGHTQSVFRWWPFSPRTSRRRSRWNFHSPCTSSRVGACACYPQCRGWRMKWSVHP